MIAQALLAGVPGRGAQAQNQAIVFVAPPGLEKDTVHALEEAVAAQVSLVGAKLVFLTAKEDDAGLEVRMTQAEDLARTHGAVGVFWVDARPSGRWFLYIMDRHGAHVVVRPLSVENTSMDAAIEAAAVIAGSASDALLNQQSVEARLKAPQQPAPAREPPDDAELRLELGYAGTLFAPRKPWIHGLSIGGSWLLPSGLYFGLSYIWSPPLRIVDEVTFQLMRYPIAAHGGVRFHVHPSLLLGGELSLGIEVRARTTTSTTFELYSSESQTRTVAVAGLRFVGEWRMSDWLVLLARASPEFVVNTFDYLKLNAMKQPETVFLSPYELRFTAQLGLAIIR